MKPISTTGPRLGFSTTRYSGAVANVLWTLMWVAAACLAGKRLAGSGSGSDLVNVIVTTFCAAVGGLITVRAFPRNGSSDPEDKAPTEPWSRRITGWFAAIVWCGVAVLWNLGIMGTLIRAAQEGKTWLVFVMIPFSLIGLLLLMVLFASAGLVLDSLLRIGQVSPPKALSKPLAESPVSQPAQSSAMSYEAVLKRSRIAVVIGLIVFLNWFLLFGVSIYLGGDALRTLPSRDGFVVNSHGRHTPVSESVWLFSLVYSGATLLMTPVIMLAVATRVLRGRFRESGRMKWLICVFILVWLWSWESGIGHSMYRSINDWSHLKQTSQSLP